MLKAEGYSVIMSPGERDKEHDTFSCAHCNYITFTKPRVDGPLQVVVIKNDQSVVLQDAGFCRKCFRHICPKCEKLRNCTPLLAKIEAEEATARQLILP